MCSNCQVVYQQFTFPDVMPTSLTVRIPAELEDEAVMQSELDHSADQSLSPHIRMVCIYIYENKCMCLCLCVFCVLSVSFICT